MSPESKVFLLVLAGGQRDACAFAQRQYPACEIEILSKKELRESDWRSRLRKLRTLKGEALVIFTQSLRSLQEPELLKWATLVHQCQRTVIADASGAYDETTRAGVLKLLPRTLIGALVDGILLVLAWVGLQVFRLWLKIGDEPQPHESPLDLAFLYPAQTGLDTPGGALSHVSGFLSGLMRERARCVVLSGRPFQTVCDLHCISGSRQHHLFRETATLSYNIPFLVAGRKLLAQKRPRLLYQRHGRFLFAGAVLSHLMKIPLVLEYNASEKWMAKYWDPARFIPWLSLCEKVSVDAASLIVVVSNALKQELVDAGVPPQRILVNQNAVDPEWFHPRCGGTKVRDDLGFALGDVVVGFVGTFSYWHGVTVLEQAIRSLLEEAPRASSLKFLLVGDGPFAPQMQNALELWVQRGLVVFTGAIPHSSVRAYLDAADILVSPHVPMPGDKPFFGSPTKLFEYMAMGKAIAASALDQIAEVLEHGRTALLVKPGNPDDLARAIQQLAGDAKLRSELGRNAMEAALERHTWQQNARCVITYFGGSRLAPTESAVRATVAVDSSASGRANLAKQNP
jgi:glycosyltransferase involved in cell wall biosynthesis